MKSRRTAFITMFVTSLVIHFLFAAAWSVHRLRTVKNIMMDPTPQIFAVVRPASLPHIVEPMLAPKFSTRDPVSTPTNNPPKKHTPIDSVLPPPPASSVQHSNGTDNIAAAEASVSIPMGLFQSTIDPKKAWINVAESVNYDLLRGIGMDVTNGEYRLPGEVDLRVRAKGDLSIEYPLIAAAMGKEAVTYVLLLIDEQGKKLRVQIVRGDADFNNAVLEALEKVEFRPAMLKGMPVRSLLLLEFDFRRNPPEIGSL
jgi:TonB family protein